MRKPPYVNAPTAYTYAKMRGLRAAYADTGRTRAHYPVWPGILLCSACVSGRYWFCTVSSHPVVPAALGKDVIMPHGPHCAVQVSIVHAFREDARVAFPADVRGAVDVGIQYLPVILPV